MRSDKDPQKPKDWDPKVSGMRLNLSPPFGNPRILRISLETKNIEGQSGIRKLLSHAFGNPKDSEVQF